MQHEENDSLNQILRLIFKNISSRDILEERLLYDRFDRKNFFNLASSSLANFSGNEIDNLYNYLVSEVRRLSKAAEGEIKEEENSFSVLEVLNIFNRKVLTEIEGMPVCRYDHLLKWRKVSFELGEELFTTSFLARLDIRRGWDGRCDFNWKSVIGNDNAVLKSILNKGLAENHFHLKGSAPYFAMSWINLMNLVNYSQFTSILKKYDQERRSFDRIYRSDSSEPSLPHQHLQATAIRLFLFTILTDRDFTIIEEYELPMEDVWNWLNLEVLHEWDVRTEADKKAWEKRQEELKERARERGGLSMEELLMEICPKAGHSKTAKQFVSCMEQELSLPRYIILEQLEHFDGMMPYSIIFELLRRIPYICINTNVLRNMIKQQYQKPLRRKVIYNRLKEILMQEQDLLLFRDNLCRQIRDFCIDESGHYGRECYDYMLRACGCAETEMELLSGERYFMYAMFKGLYLRNPELTPYGNLFYAYLIIKERIRSELIQVNEKVGFDNFLRYQNRKEEFIDNTPLEKAYSRYAVRSTLETQSVIKLEARITPRNTARGNRDYIAKLDKGIGISPDSEMKKKVFYVFHFVKEPEKPDEVGEEFCRHYRLRRKIAKQAVAIEAFREKYQKQASRVYGIDACSPEIGCRPEVFAQAFRYLKSDQVREIEQIYADGPNYHLPRLGCTYHVGEDFLDIVDGMRAIDEAVYYLNLSYGDRLGHALALGVSPVEWYRFKRSRVLISKHDNLDNIVWIYEKIRKYDIPNTQNLLLDLERQFTHCFQDIYGRELGRDIDIHVYYDAWKLRGDDPELYIGGVYKELVEQEILSEWEYRAINRRYEELDKIRREKKCTQLYSLYHYNEEVKRRGKQIVESRIEQPMIQVVAQIQACMQREIVEKGLCIETNPSSNVLISTFQRYDRHPIVKWFNKGLTNDPELLNRCPQIDVTINTDDQAVFGTSLENEYALMAIALEKMKDENGKPIYNISMIYDWLDRIRKLGKARCFNQELVYDLEIDGKNDSCDAELKELASLLSNGRIRRYLKAKLREEEYED